MEQQGLDTYNNGCGGCDCVGSSRIFVRRLLTLLLLIACSAAYGQAAAQSDELFPRPAELEPAVRFWVRVYTEVDTSAGFLHDSRNLAVVYTRASNDKDEIEAARDKIKADLRVLASGRRNSLTPAQREILALWPADVSNQTLRTAASNVRWQLGQSNRFRLGLQRSGAYRQHITDVIEEKSLPQELGVLPHVESSFNPNAMSSASAAGMWQFGRATGQRFMRIDHIIDERMDPYIATYAAMSLLEFNHSVLGTWPLALTAYNHGAGGIARAVRQTGTTDIATIIANYRGRLFGFASRNFYPQFLAVLEIEDNLQHYFSDVRLNPAPNFIEVNLDAFIDAEVFARSVGVSVEQLRADNQALRAMVWEGGKRIPMDFPIKVRAEEVNGSNLLAMVPNRYKFAAQLPDIEYIVERGDSLSAIAARFSTSVPELVSLNQLASRHRIQIGQRLLLPHDNINAQQLIAAAADAILEGDTYIVRSGDTISRIAARYGVTIQSLLSINSIQDPRRIYPGQRITLPGFADPALERVTTEPEATSEQPEPAQLASTSAGEASDDEELQTSTTAASESSTLVTAAEPEPASEQVIEQSTAPATELAAELVAAQLAEELAEHPQTTHHPVAALQLAGHYNLLTASELSADTSNEQLSELLAADPSDYTVAPDNSIEIHASETLGHYAEWLGIRAQDIRRLNRMAFHDPVFTGERLKLDFSRINIQEFELQRQEFHSTLQREFFTSYRIRDVEHYKVRSGDNVATLARNRYSTPIWLLRQYNPGLELSHIQIGQEIVFPLLEAR